MSSEAVALLGPVVWCFFGDRDVVHVALAEAGGLDATALRSALELRDRAAAAVAHPRAQTADELMDHGSNAAFVGDAPLDSFRHELLGRGDAVEIEVILEIAVTAAAAHRADRSHAAVVLIAPPLIEDDLTRALVGPREEIPDHRRARANRERLGDVAGKPDPAIRDDRDVVRVGRTRTFHDRRDHRHTDAGDDARRADRAGAGADFHRIHAGGDRRLRTFGRWPL